MAQQQRPGPVLVTGANSGIGLATSIRLAERGWQVWGTVRSRPKAAALRAAARAGGVEAAVRPVVLDVSDHDAVRARFARFPSFYAVVNNAGTSLTGAVEEVAAEEAKALLDVNLVTPGIVAACALPGMRRRGSGRIVMVSSIAGRVAIMPFQAWYHASKFGLEALSDVLRLEVAPFGVAVVVVEPGFVATQIMGKSGEQMGTRNPESSPYAAGYRRVADLTDLVERVAPTPHAVARTIVSAIESRHPRRRYLVGREALPIRGISMLPDSVTDRVVSLVAGLSAPDTSEPS